MCSAESLPVLGHSPISPYTFVASTTFSRRPPPCANQSPRIRSVTPSPFFQPYTSAVSKRLIPSSSARSMIAKLSFGPACGPKFIVPSASRLTLRPVPVSYTHLRAHETPEHLVCRLL